MSLSSIFNSAVTGLFGNGAAGEQYAANAALQWRTHLANRTEPPSGAWLNQNAALLAAYGPPGADVLAQFNAQTTAAVGEGFAEAPGIVADAIREGGDALVTGTLANVWRAIPTSVKVIGGTVLALYVYNLGMKAGFLPSPSDLAKKIKK